MSPNITRTTTANLQRKFHLNGQDVDPAAVKNFKKSVTSDSTEANFSELHALFEIQYEKFITDTSDEITRRAQRLVELESIVYGNSTSK